MAATSEVVEDASSTSSKKAERALAPGFDIDSSKAIDAIWGYLAQLASAGSNRKDSRESRSVRSNLGKRKKQNRVKFALATHVDFQKKARAHISLSLTRLSPLPELLF